MDVGCSVTCSPAFLMLYLCFIDRRSLLYACFTYAALLMLYLCCVTGLLMLYFALLMLYLTQVFELNAVDFGCNVTCSPGGRYVLHEALSY